MRIAILTQPLCNNYGGILQNFALQTILRRLGHEVVTLNTPVPEIRYSKIRLLLSCVKRLLRKCIYKDPSIVYINPQRQHNKSIANSLEHKRFIDTYISSMMVEMPITSEFCRLHQFNAYVVGSDQVWRPRYNQHLQNFYLDFTANIDVKRIAYAASFGVDSWELESQETERIKMLAQRFDAISVREASGVDLCDKYLGVSAKWVLDPTMLLEAEDYLRLSKAVVKDKDHSQPYIGVYVLDINRPFVEKMEQLSAQIGLPIKYLGRMTTNAYPSIEEWLEGISNAEYVVTDSFHGTVFSIIFNKRFLSVGNTARGNARFESLLSMFDLKSRLVSLPGVGSAALSANIDYDKVNEILLRHRLDAFSFWEKNLNILKV